MIPRRGRPVRMTDIAREVGVSSMTVSRAFRGDAGINAQTRAVILKAAEDMGYVFDATASSLRQQRSGFVAVTVPSINNANFAETVRQLTRGLSRSGLQILLANTEYDPEEEERLVAELLRRKPQAIVVTVGDYTLRTRQMLRAAGIPVVEIWDLPEDPIHHVIGFSNTDCVQKMIDHLVAQGYSRITYLGGDSSADPRGAMRRRGFIDAMKRHGLNPDALIGTGPAPVGMAQGTAALEPLLSQYPQTEVAVCVSDLVAFGLLSECQRQKIDVPGRLAITGFGNYDLGQVCVPRLTTTDVYAGRIGAAAADLIARSGGQSDHHTAERIDVGAALILRGSTSVFSSPADR